MQLEPVWYNRLSRAVVAFVLLSMLVGVVVIVWIWPQNVGAAPTYTTNAPIVEHQGGTHEEPQGQGENPAEDTGGH
ncbi:MAG: hypothetical protein M3281_04495 [Chloroflexota bacterium]|nr:hypothetical protein [Chloroflexota bacterium]